MGIWVLSDPVPLNFVYAVCKQVCVCVCVSLPVNRALIALALQLGDFQSKKNSGINNEGILKVLKCVIILRISIETFFA